MRLVVRVIWTKQLALLGMITDEERKALNEIYNCNPILFDYVPKANDPRPVDGKEAASKGIPEQPADLMIRRKMLFTISK